MGVWTPVMVHGDLTHAGNGAKLVFQLTLLQIPGGWSAPASAERIDHSRNFSLAIWAGFYTQRLSVGVSLPNWIPYLWPKAELLCSLLLRECLLCRVQMAALRGWRHRVVFTKPLAFLAGHILILSYLSPFDVLLYMIFPHLIQRISVTKGLFLL